MSVGLRNQRGRIYNYSDAGSDGFVNSTYTFAVERWCRYEPTVTREQTLGGKADQQLDGIVAFSQEVTEIGINSLIVVGDVQLKVVGVRPLNQQREIICDVVLSTEALTLVDS